jgi:hypothetical protein
VTTTLCSRSVPEILEAAAGVVERNGWARETYFQSPGRELKDPRECPVCPRGAIAVAVGRHPMFVADWPEFCEAKDATDPGEIAELAQAEQADRAAIIAAEETLTRYLLAELDHPPTVHRPMIEDWADRPGRTLEQVLAALRDCARREREAGR